MIEAISPIHLSESQLALVRSILQTHTPNIKAFAFGSRIRAQHKKHSDLDIALMTNTPMDWRVLADLREAFEESELPIRVDVIDWSTCSEEFKKLIDLRVPLFPIELEAD